MGVTEDGDGAGKSGKRSKGGASGLFCCGKSSVAIMDTQSNLPERRFESQLAQENKRKLSEPELLEHEPLPKVDPYMDLDTDTDADMDMDMDMDMDTDMDQDPDPQLQADLKMPSSRRESSLEMESEAKKTNLRSFERAPEQPNIKFFHPDKERNLGLRNLRSVEEEHTSISQHSISIQTSDHLFWADKHIQASEHSLLCELGLDPKKNVTDMVTSSGLGQESVPNDTLCSRAQKSHPTTSSQMLATSPRLSSSSLPTTIGLADLINFASSLVMASSTKELPTLEHLVKAPTQRAKGPSTEPIKEPAAEPRKAELELEKPTEVSPKKPQEKPLEAGEPQVWGEEHKSFPGSLLGLNNPGIKQATIEGEVKFLQSPALAPLSQAAMKDSVPGTKNGSPLLLKIHFKLSSPSSPQK